MGDRDDEAAQPDRIRDRLAASFGDAAEAFEHTAELADEHARRLTDERHDTALARIERERAQHARELAERARENARRLQDEDA
jgi:hypothetical protein